MIRRRDALRDFFLVPMGWGLSLGMLSLTGCGETPSPYKPLGKSKDESQKESELLDGIPVKGTPKRKRR